MFCCIDLNLWLGWLVLCLCGFGLFICGWVVDLTCVGIVSGFMGCFVLGFAGWFSFVASWLGVNWLVVYSCF